jgi:hypothetical protein
VVSDYSGRSGTDPVPRPRGHVPAHGPAGEDRLLTDVGLRVELAGKRSHLRLDHDHGGVAESNGALVLRRRPPFAVARGLHDHFVIAFAMEESGDGFVDLVVRDLSRPAGARASMIQRPAE